MRKYVVLLTFCVVFALNYGLQPRPKRSAVGALHIATNHAQPIHADVKPENNGDLTEKIDNKEVHHTVKDGIRHIQKREHQGLLPHNILKLVQPTIQSRPKIIQDPRVQIQPRQILSERPQAFQQRPINLRLNSAINPQRRVPSVINNPVHHNNATTPSVAPIPHTELLKNLDVKTPLHKQEEISTPVLNHPVVHIMIPKDTPKCNENHKTPEFFEDESDEDDDTPIYHPENFNKIAVKPKPVNLDAKNVPKNKMEIKKTNDVNKAELNAITDNDNSTNENDKLTNKVKEQTKVKSNVLDGRSDIHDNATISHETTSDKKTEKKTVPKQPVLKTPNKTEKKLLHSIKKVQNNYTDDNIISIKARKNDNKKKTSKTELKDTPTSTESTNNDKINNVLIQNRTYEEVFERSFNSKPPVFYNKRSSNFQTPEYPTCVEQYIDADSRSPVPFYTEDYKDHVPYITNIECKYNQYTNCYENDPNIFYNQDDKPFENISEDKIDNNNEKPYMNRNSVYQSCKTDYIDRIWRTWRNSEVRVNNNVPSNVMDCKLEVPTVEYSKKELLNAVIPRITNGNLIGVNGCYKNQNKPVTCRYCPSYQCYY